jgi:hypothetical protein
MYWAYLVDRCNAERGGAARSTLINSDASRYRPALILLVVLTREFGV